MVLMQLLQKWFQGLEQPAVSVTQQSAMTAALAAHSVNSIACKPAVNDQPADCTSQATVSNHSAAMDGLAPELLPSSAGLCSPEKFAAVADCLSVPQKMLIGKILNSLVAMTDKGMGCNSKQALMPWLVVALTTPGQCGANSPLNLQQQTLLKFLELCASSSTALQTLTASSRQPASKVLAVALAQNTSPTVVAQSTDVAAIAQDMNLTAVNQSMEVPNGASMQPVLLQQVADERREGGLSAGDGLGFQAKSAEHVLIASPSGLNANPLVSDKLDHEVDHGHDDGCMWLHTRLIKSGLGRLHTRAGRPNAV